ncbi:hypothetical protein [Niveispirillum lacus]|nr:hypothetical protein [Niveispirillum lacus]
MSISIRIISEGVVRGIELGQRPSGLRVGHADNARSENAKLQIVLPPSMEYAPSVYEWAASQTDVSTASDGRVVIMPGPTEADLLAALDALVMAGDRGGIAPGVHGDFTVSASSSAWRYEVEGPASARPSLKRIGGEAIVGAPNRLGVPFEHAEALLGLFAKTTRAAAKAAKGDVVLPQVPGIAASVSGGQIILAGWPGDAIADLIKAVPTARWDSSLKSYSISTRYAKAAIKAIDEAGVRISRTRAAIMAQPWAPLTITFSETQATASYGGYCDGAYKALIRLGRVSDKAVTFDLAVEDPKRILGALRDAVAALVAKKADDDRAAAAALVAERERAEARSEARRTRRQFTVSDAPAPGEVFSDGFSILVSTGSGQSWHQDGDDHCYVYTREATEAEAAAFRRTEASRPKVGQFLALTQRVPAVGDVVRLPDGMPVVVTKIGKSFFFDTVEDTSASSHVSSQFWEEWVSWVSWRQADANEVAA